MHLINDNLDKEGKIFRVYHTLILVVIVCLLVNQIWSECVATFLTAHPITAPLQRARCVTVPLTQTGCQAGTGGNCKVSVFYA